MTTIDRHAIAARIRGLIGEMKQGDVETIAGRLAVTELALRLSIDADSPHPTIDVIVAVTRDYGVDPMWLLTGDYMTGTHRLAENDESASVHDALHRIAHETETPVRSMLAQLG